MPERDRDGDGAVAICLCSCICALTFFSCVAGVATATVLPRAPQPYFFRFYSLVAKPRRLICWALI